MDTRGTSGSRDSFRPVAELGTETVPVDLVELVQLRYEVTARQGAGLGAAPYVFALLGVLAIIAVLAIATSTGWSVVDAY